MQQAKRILFITAPVGAGHTRAAQAVRQALQQFDTGVESRLANIFDFFHPAIGQSILRIYLSILAFFPALYGSMYQWGNDSALALKGREWINRYLAARMQRFIAEYNPDAIVCTHATPAGLAAYLKRHGIINIPVLAVVTDFVVHRLWIYPELDHYYVAHPSLQDFLKVHGIPGERSTATGIPVDNRFSQCRTNEAKLSNFGLNADLPTILVMGGGAGVLPMEDILSVCEKFVDKAQTVAVTGHNTKLYHTLVNKYKNNDHIRILGYVDTIPELMAVSRVIITKPGGMTSAEALCTGLPMIIFRPIPGQEDGNASYLQEQQVAEKVNSLEALYATLSLLIIMDKASLQARCQRALELARPHAAQDIACHILKFTPSGQARS